MPTPHRVTRLRGLVNAWLVEEDDGLTLVDALDGGGAGAILAAVREAGAPLRRVVLTHGHPDHAGAVDRLPEDVELLCSGREARLLRGDRTVDPGERGRRPVGFSTVRREPARLLEDGDRVGSLRVVACAGHTPGHAAFLDERDGTLFCGDAFTTVGGVATTARPALRFPFPALGTWHRPTMLEGCARLVGLAPEALAPGHGDLVRDPVAAMRRAVDRGAV